MFNPLDYPAMYTRPIRIIDSAWIEHVPFAMTLVEMLRPRCVVELGTYRGVSYSAFCQSILRLQLSCSAYNVDTWQGDPQSGMFDDTIYLEWKKFHDQHFSSFSRMMRMKFNEAQPRLPKASVDLLHIDGFHTYEAVAYDFETWKSKVSDCGVILFHDITERAPTFGVWKLWGELSKRYPSFEFHHNHGLGILAYGPNVPAPLRVLTDASADEKQRIRDHFACVGAGLSAEFYRGLFVAEVNRLNQVSASLVAEVERHNLAYQDALSQLRRLQERGLAA